MRYGNWDDAYWEKMEDFRGDEEEFEGKYVSWEEQLRRDVEVGW